MPPECLCRKLFEQTGVGRTVQERRWSTRWQALSRWTTACSACSTVPCHRPVTRATTDLLTRRVSSTLTTLRSMPTLPTSSSTTPGPGGVQTSATSSERRIVFNSNVEKTVQRPLISGCFKHSCTVISQLKLSANVTYTVNKTINYGLLSETKKSDHCIYRQTIMR